MRYQYKIYVPGGNKTALVLSAGGLENDAALRKSIQDKIIELHKNDADGEVEQVGFVGGGVRRQLIMTGNEFCGNAARSAAAHFLDGRAGETEITVSGTSKPLSAGISFNGEAWSQMPVPDDLETAITNIKDGLFWVTIEGISHLVVPPLQAASQLGRICDCDNNHERIKAALAFLEAAIDKNRLRRGNAYGVIFLEDAEGALKMHPFVRVGAAGTAYYETGCGSGAVCVGLVYSMLCGESVELPLLQPSGKIIKAEVLRLENGGVTGKISGVIEYKGTYEAVV